MKVLIISAYIPYKNVPHAGGKVHDYYINRLAENNNYEVSLITCASIYEKKMINYNSKINYSIYWHDETDINIIKKYIRKTKHFIEFINPFHKYCHLINKDFKNNIISLAINMKQNGYIPDIISLEWTQCLVLLPEIKKIYPECRYCCFEHDVTYQGFYRKYINEKNLLLKILKKNYYKKIKKLELNLLQECNNIFLLNYKDKQLLLNENIENTNMHVLAPFYMQFFNFTWNPNSKNIIFYGAMNRLENYKSVIWFIKHVFNKLSEEYNFIVIGNNPNKKLLKFASKRIIFTGYVENLQKIFQDAFCMVAPLVLGAGIKIKILEGFSAGLPILTNTIGIEGIPAKNGIHYLFCESPNDYIEAIKKLENNKELAFEISKNGREMVRNEINFETSKYIESI